MRLFLRMLQVIQVMQESSVRTINEESERIQGWTSAGCHWTQIRLPSSLSTADVTVQVNLLQPSASLEDIRSFSEIGSKYNYCFVVYTQGAAAISSSMLDESNEAGLPHLCHVMMLQACIVCARTCLTHDDQIFTQEPCCPHLCMVRTCCYSTRI